MPKVIQIRDVPDDVHAELTRRAEAAGLSEESTVDLVALDDALTSLAHIDPRQSRIVELRFFGGLSTEEVAEVLGVSPITVKREWRTAKAWLHREVSKSGKDG